MQHTPNCTHTHTHTLTQTCMHTHTHMHAHTHIHTHSRTHCFSRCNTLWSQNGIHVKHLDVCSTDDDTVKTSGLQKIKPCTKAEDQRVTDAPADLWPLWPKLRRVSEVMHMLWCVRRWWNTSFRRQQPRWSPWFIRALTLLQELFFLSDQTWRPIRKQPRSLVLASDLVWTNKQPYQITTAPEGNPLLWWFTRIFFFWNILQKEKLELINLKITII